MKDLKVIFMGTPDFSVPVLKMLIKNTNVVLVVTKEDKEVGRHHVLTKSPIKVVALENNIKVITPKSVKKDYDEIINTPCDIIITCAYGNFIPKEVLDYPRLGCINVHASLLPKYRGGAPIHWALINGENKTGITIMYMDEKMDNGDIIEQEEINIQDDDNVGILHDKLSLLGASLLEKVLPSIINGTNKRIKQDLDKVSFGYNVNREDERLDFNKTCKEIYNKVRGLYPFPVANILVNNEEFKVTKVDYKLCDVKSVSKVVDVTKDSILISAKDGLVGIKRIKPYGKKEMAVKDYLNGVKKEDILKWEINNE